MRERNRLKDENLRTARQWAAIGYVVNPDAAGEEMWANHNQYTEKEVHEATPEELNAFWKSYGDKKNARRKILPLKRIIMKGRSVVPDIFCVIIESVLYLLFMLFVLGMIAGYLFLMTHLIRAAIDLAFKM